MGEADSQEILAGNKPHVPGNLTKQKPLHSTCKSHYFFFRLNIVWGARGRREEAGEGCILGRETAPDAEFLAIPLLWSP